MFRGDKNSGHESHLTRPLFVTGPSHKSITDTYYHRTDQFKKEAPIWFTSQCLQQISDSVELPYCSSTRMSLWRLPGPGFLVAWLKLRRRRHRLLFFCCRQQRHGSTGASKLPVLYSINIYTHPFSSWRIPPYGKNAIKQLQSKSN